MRKLFQVLDRSIRFNPYAYYNFRMTADTTVLERIIINRILFTQSNRNCYDIMNSKY